MNIPTVQVATCQQLKRLNVPISAFTISTFLPLSASPPPPCMYFLISSPMLLTTFPLQLHFLFQAGVANYFLIICVDNNGQSLCRWWCCSVTNHARLLQPNGLQHARLPCPSLSPKVCSNSCPLNHLLPPTLSAGRTEEEMVGWNR